MSVTLVRDKLDAHDHWLERRYWCIEHFGEEDDSTWWWDPLDSKFYFADPNNELIFKLVWA